MNRREYLATSTIGMALMGKHASAANRKPPNLLYIFPDQLRREAMNFWSKDEFKGALRTAPDPVVTPVIDELADQSIVFNQAVSTHPLCSPYRGMLLSGMYPMQNGVTNNCRKDREDGLRPDIVCFTDVIERAGYETCYIGKTHWARNEPLFNEAGDYVGTLTAPGGHHMNGYDTFIPPGRGRVGNKYWFQCVKDVHKDPRVYSNDASKVDGKKDGEQYRPGIYSPKLEADVIVDYLKNSGGQRDASKPFSLIWAPNPPHNPYGSEEDCDEIAYREFYKDKNVQEMLLRPNVAESDPENRKRAEESVPFYFANVTGVDKQLGRVFQALKDSGEWDNTIVVFTSDHGELMGSHNKFGKNAIYEESFCVPLLIRTPGNPIRRIEDLMISPVDMMPTLLGMMGIGHMIPDTVEGKDYSSGIMTGNWSTQSKPKSALFLGPNNKSRGVRTDRYSFQINHEGKRMLFDNHADPYQMNELQLSDIPKEDADFILSELGVWLQRSNDLWWRERKFSDLIRYSS